MHIGCWRGRLVFLSYIQRRPLAFPLKPNSEKTEREKERESPEIESPETGWDYNISFLRLLLLHWLDLPCDPVSLCAPARRCALLPHLRKYRRHKRGDSIGSIRSDRNRLLLHRVEKKTEGRGKKKIAISICDIDQSTGQKGTWHSAGRDKGILCLYKLSVTKSSHRRTRDQKMAKRPTNSIVVCCVHHVRKKGRRARWQQTHTYRALGEKTKNNKRLDGLWGGESLLISSVPVRAAGKKWGVQHRLPLWLQHIHGRALWLPIYTYADGWIPSNCWLPEQTGCRRYCFPIFLVGNSQSQVWPQYMQFEHEAQRCRLRAVITRQAKCEGETVDVSGEVLATWNETENGRVPLIRASISYRARLAQ